MTNNAITTVMIMTCCGLIANLLLYSSENRTIPPAPDGSLNDESAIRCQNGSPYKKVAHIYVRRVLKGHVLLPAYERTFR